MLKSQIKVVGIFICSLFLIFFTVSCKKNEDSAKIVYGTISLDVKVMHHSWTVPNIVLYLKKNSSSFPGADTALYELRTTANSDGLGSFKQLYPGNYYLYASGLDYYFGANVVGSTPVTLSNPENSDQPMKITLMVSE